MSSPSMRLYGKSMVQILSHRGLRAYSGECIEIFSAVGIISICGKHLEITEISDEYIAVKGEIAKIAYDS